ncbi:MAG TPA: hypothetical protein VJH89_00150, partial [Patescibacteria group bacterium]|nr:hypothetical protein [Patescibacteria group bacterium]
MSEIKTKEMGLVASLVIVVLSMGAFVGAAAIISQNQLGLTSLLLADEGSDDEEEDEDEDEDKDDDEDEDDDADKQEKEREKAQKEAEKRAEKERKSAESSD